MMTKRFWLLILIMCGLCSRSFSQINRDTSLSVYFETNSITLDSQQINRLRDFSSLFHIYSIVGYADTTGTQVYNLPLSKKRAVEVYKLLSEQSQVIDKDILMYMGESTEEPEPWQNRRVKLIARRDSLNVINETGTGAKVLVRRFDLDDIYFVPDEAIVTQESIPYVKELANILKTYKTETFEIIGHINYQSRFDSTHLTDIYQLSERRAKAIFDYLISYGIAPERMTFRGVGNSQPIYPSPINDEQRRKNMRVQVIVRK
jgi:outer membrane protein OmpA-like peptidoglycan-associated protein